MKTYSAQSGYVYQYFYEGCRSFSASGDKGVEFVFSISSDRKAWNSTSVMVGDAAINIWEQSHGRALSANERYAVAKMALFQAFDERELPAHMKEAVHLRHADVEAIIETLEL